MRNVSSVLLRGAQVGFWLALVIWSWLLLKPNPFPETAKELSNWGEWAAFLAAKTLHAGCYAVLTLLVWFGWSGRVQQWFFGLVLLHGVASELGQYLGNVWFNTGRYGCVRDVLVDWLGVCVVLLVRWLWSRNHLSTR